MVDDLDLDELRRVPRISYYFRYPLRRRDFHDFRLRNELRGHYAAKPLYGRLTPERLVDRSAEYNGDVAALFVPADALTVGDANLIVTHTDPQRIVLPNGRRNWAVIREASEHAIGEQLAAGFR